MLVRTTDISIFIYLFIYLFHLFFNASNKCFRLTNLTISFLLLLNQWHASVSFLVTLDTLDINNLIFEIFHFNRLQDMLYYYIVRSTLPISAIYYTFIIYEFEAYRFASVTM